MLDVDNKKMSGLIRKIIAETKKKLSKPQATEASVFILRYFAHSPFEDLSSFKPTELSALAMHHFNLAGTRSASKSLVRVFNPTVKANGFESDHTVIEICNTDMPFLVDSLASEITRQELEVYLLIHPVIHVKRTKGGKFSSLADVGSADAQAESFIRLEITRQSSERLTKIKSHFEKVLSDIRCAVEDWRPMRERMSAVIEEFLSAPKNLSSGETIEPCEFMRLIHDNNFTFLGYSEYDLKG